MKTKEDPIKDFRNAYNNAILSQNAFISMNTRKHFKPLNTLVFGVCGSGKGRFIVKPNILQMNANYVVTDPISENLDATGEMLRRNGYNVRVFGTAPSILEDGRTMKYNPLKYCRDEKSVISLAEHLLEIWHKEDDRLDPFWEDATKMLLCSCISLLVLHPQNDERPYAQIPEIIGKETYPVTLFGLLELVRLAEDLKKFGEIFENIREFEVTGKNEDAVPFCLKSYDAFSLSGAKTLREIVIAAEVALDRFSIKQLRDLTDTDTIDLDSFGKGRDALFLISPYDNKTYNFLISLLFEQLWSHLWDLSDEIHSGKCKKMVLKNGELIRYFPEEAVEKGIEDKVQAIRNSRIKYVSPKNLPEGQDFAEGIYIATDGKGGKIEEPVKIDNGWYEIIDADNEVVSRRSTREMAEKYLADLKTAEVLAIGDKDSLGHIRFMLDEFPNIAEFPGFKEKLATMRAIDVSATVIYQSVTQLKGQYPDDYEVIDANRPFKIYMGGDEVATCEYFAKKIGHRQIPGLNKYSPHSIEFDARPIMDVDEIRTLPYSKEIICCHNEKPILDEKFDYQKHKNYRLTRDFAEDCGLREEDTLRFRL